MTLAWDAEHLHSPETLSLTSPDFADGEPIPHVHAGVRLGGEELSPALAWSTAPSETAELLLVIEDPDAPMATPYIHGLALIEPSLTGLSQGALSAEAPGPGVRLLRSSSGRGWIGMAPPKAHGPHRYVFQLFALAEPLTITTKGGAEEAQPRKVLAAAGPVLARGRIDGLYQRS
ncbi:PEBP family protein [Catenulispora acidiphila DSM 44928]|uniref:PEBP family protein n=1 Tax=Catenulispora acidiphila (strain DSM 44928 / JCM 14897 / NBRC 102108 / NRRL B-24433 / ID139908) TaxID=479433 RepID=C7QGR6_CATAD|nr:YbhB/YbcL family Raf kinase inhibitor-like protein [Catenulispora acidiphila]ACU74946.1 PEBP family protein [Catenulispora acidiphila DSM 44928]